MASASRSPPEASPAVPLSRSLCRPWPPARRTAPSQVASQKGTPPAYPTHCPAGYRAAMSERRMIFSRSPNRQSFRIQKPGTSDWGPVAPAFRSRPASCVPATAAVSSPQHRAETGPPEPDRFMADVDATFVQKVLEVSQQKRKTDIHHNSQTDDVRVGSKVRDWVGFSHLGKLRDRLPRSSSIALTVPAGHMLLVERSGRVSGATSRPATPP